MIVDLRSDTVTQPSVGMREAIARAEVGDDVYGDDPTVNRLQESVAEIVGTEAALYVPSGSMANQIAIKIHTQPGDDVVIGEDSHSWLYESGAAAIVSGVQMSFAGKGGLFTVDDLRAQLKSDDHHHAPTRLVSIENTHNRGGGIIWPSQQVADILAFAQENNLRTHLDGARLWNVAAKRQTSMKELAAGFDTVSVCLSKGLGAPVGSLICGTKDDMYRAHRVRKILGGAMRQAGFLAAAGLYALQHNRDRLTEDHANAMWIAKALVESGKFAINLDTVQTNIVVADLRDQECDAPQFVKRAAKEGVLLNFVSARSIRLVTHLDVSRSQSEYATQMLAKF